MCSLVSAWNPITGIAMFPASYSTSSYGFDFADDSAKLISIPIEFDLVSNVCFCVPSSIPAFFINANSGPATMLCIYFHGNGCDAGQIVQYALEESREFNCYYIIVEYPGYGVGLGISSESAINAVARSVWNFVDRKLLVDSSRVVLIGRSIGTGPATYLASYMEKSNRRPAALILQSPYISIRSAGARWAGGLSCCMLDRWQNWKLLSGDKSDAVTCPVLFLHADNDRIIDCSHSRRLHAARLALGLQSTLFIQKSSLRMKKGHNLFLFEEDYLYPCKDFIEGVSVRSSLMIPEQYLHLPSMAPPPKYVKGIYRTILVMEWLLSPISLCLECVVGCSIRTTILASAGLIGDSTAYSPFELEQDFVRSLQITDNMIVEGLYHVVHTFDLQYDPESEIFASNDQPERGRWKRASSVADSDDDSMEMTSAVTMNPVLEMTDSSNYVNRSEDNIKESFENVRDGSLSPASSAKKISSKSVDNEILNPMFISRPTVGSNVNSPHS